jgi:hypothetical protein
MPCDLNVKTEAERVARQEAILDLAVEIALGKKRVVRSLSGQVCITGWDQSKAKKVGWCEGCAIQFLTEHSDTVVKERLKAMDIKQGAFVAASHNGHAHYANYKKGK